MRGSPLVRALIVFALLLCLAPLLWHMTNATSVTPANAPSAGAVAEQDLQVELAFTVVPRRVAVMHLAKEVWAKENPDDQEDFEVRLPWPAEGGELSFTIDWPDDAPLAAMRVRLTDAERGEIERTLWGTGPRTGVLGFP